MRLSLLVSLGLCCSVKCYEILGLFPNKGSSHFKVYGPVMRALAEKGHNVTVLSYSVLRNPPPSYRSWSLEGGEALQDAHQMQPNNILIRMVVEPFVLLAQGLEACEDVLNSELTKKVMRGELRFDLIIAEQFHTDCSFVFLHKLNIPFVAFSSDTLFPWMFPRAGVPNNPSYIPNHSLAYGRQPDFCQRTLSSITILLSKFIYQFRQWRTDQLIAKHVQNIPPLETLVKNVSLILVYAHPVLYGSDPVPANVIFVGGAHVTEQPSSMPSDLEKFISDAPHGVVYVSFGSMVKASSMPQDKVDAFLAAFSQLKQRVLWKWENESLPGAPPNLLTKKWMPQIDILSHKNVKAFVSHGGMLGTTEAIHTGVPMLTIPLFGDQFANAASVRESGLGVTLQFEDITKESVLAALDTLLEPKMYANAKRLSQIWHDRPMSPMDTAIYWIEYVARYQGAPHLRSAAVDLPLYQYLLLDVIAFLGAITLIVLYVNYQILKLLLRLCCGSSKSKNLPEKTKTKKTKKEN